MAPRLSQARVGPTEHSPVLKRVELGPLWLGHANMQTTEMYTRADPSIKLEVLDAVTAPKLRSGRFRASDKLIASTALNRPFAEWCKVFPNAACVVSLVDRLVHNAEIIAIDGDSYRLKEGIQQSNPNTIAASPKPARIDNSTV
jgi:hypothetical protein